MMTGHDLARSSAALRVRAAQALLAALLCAPVAQAQPAQPTLFVAHNGNLEGSVSTLHVECDGALTFVSKFVTGSKPSSQDYDPGTNAYSVSLSPGGRFLVTSHATSSSSLEQLTLMQVAADGTLTEVQTFTTPDSPLDVEWLGDDLLAVTETRTSGTNNVRIYAFDAEELALSPVDVEPTGAFSSSLAVHPAGGWLFAQTSTGASIRSFAINPDGTLDLVNAVSTGAYPLGLGVSPDGGFIYGGGGISSGGKAIVGCQISEQGVLTLLPDSPFTSPGSSPKQVALTRLPVDDRVMALVAHGTDATIRVFSADDSMGALSDTGFSFDVGIQGELGSVATLGDLVFVTDNFNGATGVRALRLGTDGTLTPIGNLVSTQGTAPLWMAVWAGSACPADLDGNGEVSILDLNLMLASFELCKGDEGFFAAADLMRDCCIDQLDLNALLAAFGSACR